MTNRGVLSALLAIEAVGLAGFFGTFYRPDWTLIAFGSMAAAALIGIAIQLGIMLRA